MMDAIAARERHSTRGTMRRLADGVDAKGTATNATALAIQLAEADAVIHALRNPMQRAGDYAALLTLWEDKSRARWQSYPQGA